jgi:hypothetical protein
MIGQLVVELAASTAKYQASLNEAVAHTEASAKRIEHALNGAFSGLSTLAGTLGVGLSVAGIVAWGESVVAAAEHLHNLSIETGSSVESLSRLANIAKISGTSFDTFQTMIDRLAAGMGGAEGKSTRIGEALKLLGVNATDPANALQQVADKLAKYADGANKAALAKDLFGRSGVEFLSTLKAIADQTGIAATKTTDQANRATELAETFRQLTIQSHALGDALLNDVAPGLTKVITAMSEAAKLKGGVFAGLGLVAGISPFASIDENISDTQKQIDDLQTKIANVKASAGGFWAKIAPSSQDTTNLEATAGTLEKQLKLLQIMKGQSLGNLDFLDKDRRPFAPILPPKGTGAADDPARKILEAALAALKAATEQEKAILANRDEYLKAIFERGDTTIQDYYAGKQAAQDQDLRRTSENYLQEIALIDDFIRRAATQKDKAQGEKEKVAATAREQLAIIQAAGKSQQILDEQDKSLRDYGHALDEINAKMLELQGNTAAAAGIRFDVQHETERNRLNADVASPTSTQAAIDRAKAAKDQLDATEKITVAQGKLNDVQTKYTLIIDQLAVKQGRIDLQQQTGQITELQGINAKASAAQERIAQLTDELAKYSLIANDPNLVAGPIKSAAILRVEQMRLEIDKLAAQSDVLAAKFRDAFESSSTTFLTDLISHTKTAKQSVLDLGKSIEQSISQIAAKDISERVFGKSGPLGSVPDLFAKWFGGGSATAAGQVAGDAFLPGALGAGGGATTAAALTLVDAPAIALAASLTAAASAATMFSIAASAGGLSGAFMGSGAGGLDALIGPGGLFGFASGTDYVPRDMIAKIHQGEKITPAAQNRSGGASGSNVYHITNNVNVSAGASRASIDHTMSELGRQIERSTQRTR